MQGGTSLKADNHANAPPLRFLQAGCPSCRSINSVKALKVHSKPQVKNSNRKLKEVKSKNRKIYKQ